MDTWMFCVACNISVTPCRNAGIPGTATAILGEPMAMFAMPELAVPSNEPSSCDRCCSGPGGGWEDGAEGAVGVLGKVEVEEVVVVEEEEVVVGEEVEVGAVPPL